MYSRPTRGAATSDDDDKYCSFSTKQTELGSIYLEEYLGDTRQETQSGNTTLGPFFPPGGGRATANTIRSSR